MQWSGGHQGSPAGPRLGLHLLLAVHVPAVQEGGLKGAETSQLPVGPGLGEEVPAVLAQGPECPRSGCSAEGFEDSFAQTVASPCFLLLVASKLELGVALEGTGNSWVWTEEGRKPLRAPKAPRQGPAGVHSPSQGGSVQTGRLEPRMS